uniref:uncharacterized protein LOC114588766 n=1 Tax=Podarcis muralis TaxID=64176 RepID=UPI00109FBF9D|nr:uncharacterized protein LOC114588766 [Podarcis muralis]
MGATVQQAFQPRLPRLQSAPPGSGSSGLPAAQLMGKGTSFQPSTLHVFSSVQVQSVHPRETFSIHSSEEDLPVPRVPSSDGKQQKSRRSKHRAKRRKDGDTSSSTVGNVASCGREMKPVVWAKVSVEGTPVAMVVQLGENDLPEAPSLSLQTCMRENLKELKAALSGLKIFWSQLLQRRAWRGSRCPAATKRARRHVQSAVAKKVLALGRMVIHHPGITSRDASLYRLGVHLSVIGIDLWLTSVSVGLRDWLQV